MWTPERLKALRERAHETQEQFRHRLPVALSTIRFWETGGTVPPMASNLLDRIELEIIEAQRNGEPVPA